MPTQTHSVSPAKIALAVSFMFVAGAAAFAAAAIPRQLRGYNSMSAVCADGSSLRVQPGRMTVNGQIFEREGVCKSDRDWRAQALEFCRGKVARNGSTRMRSFRISGVCRMAPRLPLSPPQSPTNYGYNPIPPDYGYGYNPPPVMGYGYNAALPSSGSGASYAALWVIPSQVSMAKDTEVDFKVMGIQSGSGSQTVPVSGAVWSVDQVGSIVSQSGENMHFRADRTQGRKAISVSYQNPDGSVISTQIDLDIQ